MEPPGPSRVWPKCFSGRFFIPSPVRASPRPVGLPSQGPVGGLGQAMSETHQWATPREMAFPDTQLPTQQLCPVL